MILICSPITRPYYPQWAQYRSGIRSPGIHGGFSGMLLEPRLAPRVLVLGHLITCLPQLIFVADMITMLDQSLAKWSICALYYRIFSINRSHGRWIWAIAIAQAAVNIALFITQSLQCQPIHKFWEFWAEGDCMPFSHILVALEPPNSVIDFALVALAMIMIKPLHLKRSTKWRLRTLFGLGSV